MNRYDHFEQREVSASSDGGVLPPSAAEKQQCC